MEPVRPKLLFASQNPHKLGEVQAIIGDGVQIIGLHQMGFSGEIPETGSNLRENAGMKAWQIYHQYRMDCFADDTGLEVDALDGAPGVYSARFAGEGCSFQDNISKLLDLLRDQSNRKACFRTVICLILGGKEYYFEGKVEGEILPETAGVLGFGYDPVFRPVGYELSFAEMDASLKNRISHRGRAMEAMAAFLYQGLSGNKDET